MILSQIQQDVPSMVEFGSLGAVIFIVVVFLKHITAQNTDNRAVLSKVTEAFNRNTEALARTERVLEKTESALAKVINRDSK